MVKYSEYRLGDLCKRFSSGKGISADLIRESGPYPVIGGNGLRGYTDTYNFDGECAVIGRQGAYCGNVQFFSGKGYMTEHAVVAQPNGENNAVYLTYKLDGLKLGRLSGQAAQPGLSVTKIAKLRLLMPPKSYQDEIANILSTFDKLIEVNNKRIKVLEQMAENLYKEWFVRFRFPGHESVPFEYGLPQGWEFNRIGELFSTSSGGTPSRQNAEYYEDGKYMWVKTGELLDRFIIDTEEKITEDALKNSAAKIIPPYSLLCSMYAGVGKLGINAEPITCSQATCVFRPKAFLSLSYLFFWLKLNRAYLENISFGAAQQNISQDIIKKIKIMVPTDSVTRRFDNMINPVFQQILFLQRQIKKLTQMRDLLLPRLMSGKLEV